MTAGEVYRRMGRAYDAIVDVATADLEPEDRLVDFDYQTRAARFAAETRKRMNELERKHPAIREAVLEGKA